MSDAKSFVVREAAPAKINLALHVTGRRADGYHLLESLVVFTRFGDLIEVAPAETDSFVVDGPFAGDVPVDGSNLVLKARDALRLFAHEKVSGEYDFSIARTGKRSASGADYRWDQINDFFQWWSSSVARTREPDDRLVTNPLSIRLTKNLPIASGVGGGSSDAAATMRALNRYAALGLSMSEAKTIAAPLGADLPMCLAARPLVARGIGDELTAVNNVPAIPLVLVNPNVPVPTPAVFAALENKDNPPLPPLPRSFDFHGLRNWLDTTRNDLEAPARRLQPAINRVIHALDKADSGFSRMSGSGATCFGLFETNNVAKRAAALIRQRHPDWFVATTRAIPSEDPA